VTTDAVDPGLAAKASSATAAQAPPGDFSRGRRAWITIVLALVWFLAAVDRNILSVLLVPIQKDLHVNDTAMGGLTGFFALIFAFAALPLSWFVDRTNRRNFVAAMVALWSVMTALSGLATNFLQLAAARFGVGAGEAAHGPATMSMLADVFPAPKRGAAISVLAIGSAAGFSVGAYLAGLLNDRFGWHVAMMAVGAPGLAVAALVWITVPEPRRGLQDDHPEAAARLAMSEALRRIAKVRTFLPLAGGMAFLNLAFMAFLGWLPAFFMRVHHLPAKTMGAVFGLVVAGGMVSNFYSGVVSDRLAKRGTRWRMHYCVAMVVVTVPLLTAGFLIPSTTLATAALVAYCLIAGGLTPVTNAAALSIVPANLRATLMSLILLAIAVVGGGLGPLMIGAINDALKPALGDDAVRYSLMTTPFCLALAGVLFYVAGRTIAADMGDDAAVRNPVVGR
jgi:predicted MFS family arabinose efflux permease